MLSSLTSQGFGPHDGTLAFPEPMGVAEVRAPSRAGKTTKTLRLVSWTLWGCEPNGSAPDTSIIQAGVDVATLSVRTSGGTTITRTFTLTMTKDETGAKVPKLDDAGARMFSPTITMQKAGDPAPLKLGSEADLQAQLPAQLQMLPAQRGDSPVRMAFAPFAWLDLAAGNARPLRDLIAKVSGVSGDLRAVVAELMGAHPLLETDPLVDDDPEGPRGAPKVLGAASLAKAARAAEKEAAGAEREAASALDAVLPVPPAADPDALTEARAVIAADAAWTKHDAAIVTWTEGEMKRTERDAERATWRTARAELDAREPKLDAAAQKADEGAVARLTGMLDTEKRVLSQRAEALAAAKATLAATLAANAASAEREATREAEKAARPAPAPVVVEPEPDRAVTPPARVEGAPLFVAARTCPTCNQTLQVAS